MPGYHLPFFAAAANGLFARHGLDVDILDPPPGPDMEISYRVAAGGADFSLTGVTYHLFAHRDADRRLAARFVSVLQPRAGLAAVVPAASDLWMPSDLGGRRLARSAAAWLAAECVAALLARGVDAPVVVPAPAGAASALRDGSVDLIATFVDTVGIGDRAGFPVRQIPVGLDVYGSGLIAGDHVPDDLAVRVAAAVAEAFDLQRREPSAGLRSFCERFPGVDPGRAARSWTELAPYCFDSGPTGSMTRAGWQRTLDWLTGVHGLLVDAVDDVARWAATAGSPPSGDLQVSVT